MLTFLLVVHALVAAALVAVILMQRSEGGGLASSGSPGGLMSARGAADFLTRTTAILATLFVVLSIGLAALATMQKAPTKIDTSLAHSTPAPITAPAAPAPAAPAPADNNAVPLAH
jgi:preprotein translocase subunit SecG